jgi:hypothetical protein
MRMRNWLVAAIALALGGVVSAALLIFGNPDRDRMDAYVAARDLPAGSTIGIDSLQLEKVNLAGNRSVVFVRGDEAVLSGSRAAHDLVAGQLIQRSDVMAASSAADQRLVFLPVKDAPPAGPGSKVDLLVVAGTADHRTVTPFALGVDVRAAVGGGLIVVVSSHQASAFVYAADAMTLVAVISEPGSAPGQEAPVSAPDEAIAAAAGR